MHGGSGHCDLLRRFATVRTGLRLGAGNVFLGHGLRAAGGGLRRIRLYERLAYKDLGLKSVGWVSGRVEGSEMRKRRRKKRDKETKRQRTKRGLARVAVEVAPQV